MKVIVICPHCLKKSYVDPAKLLGELAKGKGRAITPEDRKRRQKWAKEMQKKRWLVKPGD